MNSAHYSPCQVHTAISLQVSTRKSSPLAVFMASFWLHQVGMVPVTLWCVRPRKKNNSLVRHCSQWSTLKLSCSCETDSIFTTKANKLSQLISIHLWINQSFLLSIALGLEVMTRRIRKAMLPFHTDSSYYFLRVTILCWQGMTLEKIVWSLIFWKW